MSRLMVGCDFCGIGTGQVDAGLVAFRSANVFVVPALRQRANNRGHALVLPVAHVPSLHDAVPELLAEIFDVVARVTRIVPVLYGALGSTVFQNNSSPDDVLFHLHVHVVPRFGDDHFAMPDPAISRLPRDERLRQADGLGRALSALR
jgi:histidine triad (HIT) family protein